MVCFPLTNTDIWWHMATARWVLAHGALPENDPFGTGAPWVNLHWLFQLGALGLYRAGGALGLVLAKVALVALGAWLLARTAFARLRAGWLPLAVVLLLSPLVLARNLVLARPVLLTMVGLALCLLLVERYLRRPRPLLLLPLLPLQLVWANGQGGLQLLGPAVVGAYAVGALLSRLVLGGPSRPAVPGWRPLGWLALALGGMGLCGLCTPFGPQGLLLPFKLLGRIDPVGAELFRLNVSENVPPWVLERGGAAALAVWSFKWVALAALASFVVPLWRRGPLVLGRLLLLGGMLGLSLLANRNILLHNWLAGAVLLLNLAPLLNAVHQRRVLLGANLAALVLFVALGLSVLSSVRAEPPPGQLSPFRVPRQAVARLQRLGLDRGTLFTSVRYGGYVIWRLHPRAQPVIDGRLVLRSAAQLAGHLDAIERPQLFEQLARARGIRVVLLPSALPGRYLPLVAHLYRSPRWSLAYTDGWQCLFVRRGLAPAWDLSRAPRVAHIGDELDRRFRGQGAVRQAARLQLAALLVAVGELAQADQLLTAQRQLPGATLPPPQRQRARLLLARLRLLQGRLDRALALAEPLTRGGAQRDAAELLLARVALQRGQPARALDRLQRVLERTPQHVEARALLRRLGRAAGASGSQLAH